MSQKYHPTSQESGTETSTALRFETYSATYAPVLQTNATLPEIDTIRTKGATLELTFDNAISQKTADTIAFTDANGNNMVASANVAKDGFSATLVLSELTDGTVYDLTVPESSVMAGVTKKITAEADLNKIYSMNFLNYKVGDTVTITESQYVDLNQNTALSVGADGYADFKWDGADSDNKNVAFQMNLDKPITTGRVAFDVKFRQNASTTSGLDRRIIGFITDKKTSWVTTGLIAQGESNGAGIGTWYSNATFVAGNGVLSGNRYTHNTTSIGDDARETYDLRVIAERYNTTDDWTISVYDKTSGWVCTTPILTTTLEASNITAVNGWYTAQTTADTRFVRLGNYSAEYIAADEALPPEKTNVTLPDITTIRTASASLEVEFDKAVSYRAAKTMKFAAQNGVNMINKVILASDGLSATYVLNTLADNTVYTLSAPESEYFFANSKEITAEADLNKIYSLDFSNVKAGTTYTSEQLKAIEPQFTDNGNANYTANTDGFVDFKRSQIHR